MDAIRKYYREPRMEIIWHGKRKKVETYLLEIFGIVVGTGRRISAICALRREDLELKEIPKAPHGAIVWPEDTDKMDRRWRCPISTPVREALESALRKRPRVLPGPLFSVGRNPDKPIRYELASKWLRQTEDKAELESHDSSLWHAYPRLWASARKQLPDVDVAPGPAVGRASRRSSWRTSGPTMRRCSGSWSTTPSCGRCADSVEFRVLR